ncbi:UDP-N-acetylmuramoylalanine--D-glutamate ligase [Thioalkalivibrio sp. ALE21]|uniref:UDP-N-acetylmuramoyl-L-alanine--D-glutamate ligase n=1 Tax=Thioalkalivibrio sp. ALE21 TaxID=1158175 RepID=UPI000D81BF84|nr:UDP-N-acetylmuramoyl-L-alanine--D-glutamate ligase [Thioalkalivibrio sp. ALE21]PYG03102.1 UDP-N-acetylmuramoylalanine--D-glutamate ligase [Thioalkalivibrio sp. ALE21]
MERLRSDNLIVGLGATGQSVARYLLARGMSFAVTDTRREPPACDDPELARILNERWVGPLDGLDASGVRRLIVSPGVALEHPVIAAASEAGAEVTGDIDLFAREAGAPVIAITGSNGKSTVTALVGELLDAAGYAMAMGGNYGTPALDLLERDPEVFVLELSSFQLERCHELAPAAAVVLNLSPDHLDRHPDMAAYLRAKQRVFRGARRGLLNRDDPMVAELTTPPGMARETFGLGAPAADADWGVCVGGHGEGPQLCRGGQALLETARLRMRGQHNWANALAALGLVWPWLDSAGRRARALAALADFPGLPHRSQWIASVDGVDWINDSKGTNLGATLAALRGTPGPLVLIAGGQAKGQDFAPLADQLAGKVRGAVLLGEDAPLIARALAPVVPVQRVDDMDAAVAHAAEWAQPGDTVLLSPACASLDMYPDYRARGDDFARAVRELAA